MPYAEQIINKVDTLIAETALTDQRFTPRLMAGLVQQIPVKSLSDAGKVIFIPAKITSLKDVMQVVPDDKFNIITYHRLISNSYSVKPGNQQYGDTFDSEVCSSDVIMIIIGFNNKLRLTAEMLEALIGSAIPDQLDKDFTKDLQMQSITIQKTSSSFDSVAIFSQEYRGETYFIKPDMSLFQIRYRIEAAYKKECFNICDCDGQSVN